MKTYTQDEAKKKIKAIFLRIEKKFADKQVTGTRSIPAAPNTGRFFATQSGFIRTTTHHCSFAYGGSATRRPFALQVGSLVTREDQLAIKKALSYAMKRAFGERLEISEGNTWSGPHFDVFCDGPVGNNRAIVSEDFGTNYSTWFLV